MPLLPPKAYNPFLSQIAQQAKRSPQMSASLSIEEFSKQSAEILSKMHNTTQYQQPSLLKTPESRNNEDNAVQQEASIVVDDSKPNDAYYELLNLQHSLQRLQAGNSERFAGLCGPEGAIIQEIKSLRQQISSETLDSQLLQLSERLRLLQGRIGQITSYPAEGPSVQPECELCSVVKQHRLAIIALQEQNDMLSRALEISRVDKAEMQAQLRKLLVQNDELAGIIMTLRSTADDTVNTE